MHFELSTETNITLEQALSFNAKFQKKKQALRAELATRGILEKKGVNSFDRYKYFSEAQYKLLFTELFSKHGLELTTTEAEHELIEGTEKQPFGAMVTIEFTLTDTETGWSESVKMSGQGFDKGDKALYKAYTGAVKYYLANNFLVATGDDPEVPDEKAETKAEPKKEQNEEKKASENQIRILEKYYTGANLEKLLQKNGIEKLADMSMKKASELIQKLTKKEEKKDD